MSNPEDKTLKSNGLGTDPMQRLASFKPPRDLSLGGAKPNKKVFTPNLNVTRNKNKGPATTNSREQKKDDKGRHDRKNNRRNQRNGPNIIKSTGVFSEGLGSAERVASRSYYGRDSDSGGGGGGGGGGAHTLERPTIRVKDVIKIDKELEEQKIKSAMGADFSSLDDDAEDFKRINEKDAPIKLPMDDGGWSQSKPKPAVKVKQEVIVKSEPRDDVDCSITSVTVTQPVVDVKKDVFEDTDVVNILRSEEPKLMLIQLPDSLPGRGGSVDDDAPRRKIEDDEPSTSTGEGKEEKPVDSRCRLADLEEGRIGKLQIHRSGRVTLSLGDTIFEVCTGTKASFHQEVVSLAADDASRSANLLALGALQHKLHVAPAWPALL